MALETDYYARLEVERDAPLDRVNKAFRKLALKHHPDRHEGSEESRLAFKDIAEAYEVLGDAKHRAIYDQYGERGLKDGVPDGKGNLIGGTYRFSGDAQRIFEKFFGASSPFADIYGALSDPTASGQDTAGPEFYGELTSLARPVKPQQPRPVSRVVSVTLGQLYRGDSITVPHTRKRLNADGVTTRTEEGELRIDIQPGWASGYKVVFPKEGDEALATVPADVVYTLKEAPSSDGFRRSGHDLVYAARISLTEALCGAILQIRTLDARTLSVGITEVVAPKYVKKVPGEGMPIPGTKGKGDLFIEFQIDFPDKLTPKQRAAIKAVKM